MGDLTRKRKTYSILEIKEIKELPPGWSFVIKERNWDFEELAKWGGRIDLAYWFSIFFWRTRNLLANDTRESYWYSYKKFWEFLESTNLDITKPEDVVSHHLMSFVIWINNAKKSFKNSNEDFLSHGTRRHIVGNIKKTFKYLIKINIARQDLRVPIVTYPNKRNNSEKTTPFSLSERSLIVDACNKAFVAIEEGRIKNYKQIYTPFLLTIALRTGINLQALLDLTIHSIKPSFLDGRLEITIKKNRGYSSQRIKMEVQKDESEVVYASKRVESLFRILVENNEKLRGYAQERDSNSLWLLPTEAGVAHIMNSREVWRSIQEFRNEYKLINGQGNPLKLNIRRMRPTFAHSMLRINGGDIRDLQKRLNHKNITTTLSYLDANQEDFKSSFKFRGIVMQEIFGSEKNIRLKIESQSMLRSSNVLETTNKNTLVAKCKDQYSSPFKSEDDINPCTKFTVCFRCPNQVITGDDAWKVFSFYWFLLSKKNFMPKKAWEKSYAWIIRTIDNEISTKLEKFLDVEKIKYKALNNPFPAWPNNGQLR